MIVPVYNRVKQIPNLLASLDRLQGVLPAEVIIIDSRSTDGTRECIDEWASRPHPFEVRCVSMGRAGPGKAKNIGISMASGDILACTDSDCIADPRWLECLYNKLVSDPDLVGVGGKVLPVKDDVYSRYYTLHRTLIPPPGVEFLVGANCMYWRSKAIEAGGFEESVGTFGGEDMGIGYTLRDMGYKLGYEDTAVIYHDFRDSLKDFYKTWYSYGYGASILLDKFNAGLARKHDDRRYFDPAAAHYYYPAFRRVIRTPHITKSGMKWDWNYYIREYTRQYSSRPKALQMYMVRLVFMLAYNKGWYDAIKYERNGHKK